MNREKLYTILIAICISLLFWVHQFVSGRHGQAYSFLVHFLYNGPILLLFIALSIDLAVSLWRMGPAAFFRTHSVVLAAWAVGFAILYFRLIAQSIEISGHMVWFPFLIVHAHQQRFPAWFILLSGACFLIALYLKFLVFGGPSGTPGLIIGILLGFLLLVTKRYAILQHNAA